MAQRKVAGKASAGRMGDLHGKLTELLLEMLDGETLVEDDEHGVPQEVHLDPSPQVLNVARAFLKDNEIVAAIDENENMTDLQSRLKERQKEAKARRFGGDKPPNVVPIKEAKG